MGERVIESKFNVHENYNKVKIKNPYRYVSGGGGIVVPDFIAYYPFNNGSLVDESGNGYDATFNNMTLTTGKDGDADGAYNNNGPRYMSLPIGVLGAEKSYSLWVKPSDTRNSAFIFFTDSSLGVPSVSDAVGIESGKLRGYTFAGGVKSLTTVQSILLSNWQHITITFKNNGFMYAYYNGVQINGLAIGTRWTGGDRILIAKNTNTFNNSFLGDVDYIRVYDRELTSAEVTEIYNAEL